MRINRRTFTIANGASLSDAQKLNDSEVVMAIEMPSAWTTANLTFKAGTVADSIQSYYRQGTEVSIAVVASSFQELDAIGYLSAAKYIQLRSGTAASPVAQGAARTLILVTLEL
jgi:hypothetical protein